MPYLFTVRAHVMVKNMTANKVWYCCLDAWQRANDVTAVSFGPSMQISTQQKTKNSL
jgi:hypothetical protein